MVYPARLFADQADHTYVKCGTGQKAWGCWGGKRGGRVLRHGQGSTKRADKIAQPNERAGIKCYLINGVCHQAANRILLPARITVRGARGYSISEALFGTYGKVGYWLCKSPFKQHKAVTGDLTACTGGPVRSLRTRAAAAPALTEANKLDWHYTKGVLDIYGKAATMMRARAVRSADVESLHIKLFMHMAEFHLGPMFDRALSRKLKQVRRDTEKVRARDETAFADFAEDKSAAQEFVDTFNRTTLTFQDEMANVMKPEQYEALFDLKPDDRVVLADRNIVKKVYGIK